VAPVEQFDRRPHVLLNDDGLPVGGIRTAQAGPQSPQEMPHRVGVEQLLFAGVVAIGDDAAGPTLDPGHLLVAWREGPGGDQDAA